MIKTFLAAALTFMMSVSVLAAPRVIELNDKNTVVMRVAFTDESVSKVVSELVAKDAALPPGVPIYLFMDTPGGSVTAGMDLIQAAKGIGREIKTITSFAASMGFITVQNLGERIILPYGVLMSHRASGGVQGQIPGEIDTRYVFWSAYIKQVMSDVAVRLKMTPEQYEARHYNEWWTTGDTSVEQGVADNVASVKCGKSMTGTTKETVSTIFGSVNVTYSKCPLVKAPLSVDMKGIAFQNMSPVEHREFLQATSAYFYNKAGFLRDYVLTGKFNRIFN